ncbi:MAG TPA: DUF2950 domain-containing protein [Thermoanaerobaculia bacterium]|nr:DUF2950 domain-containing protein [Thermoanaerobaculia bacterium]HQR65816.1 DUF2950 domain-containing protein [Thermoanaerobaculia bacterium]
MTSKLIRLSLVVALSLAVSAAAADEKKPEAGKKPAPAPAVKQRTFPSAQEAGTALIAAAASWDVPALTQILGPDGVKLVTGPDPVQDRNQAAEFAALARIRYAVIIDPAHHDSATLVVGDKDWPLAIPIVRAGKGWRFDSKKGAQELLYRRVGRNELDAIQVCHGYVEAQREYASKKRDGALVNQYAQKIISTPGKQDGLAWQTADGRWEGPVGENVARAIAQGYSSKAEPYHGYYFKVLKGQGPAAPLGRLDFVVGGAMIGGFALVAAPAEYRVTGVKTFIVSHDGVVYEKDFGEKTLENFRTMELYNPDKSWSPVEPDGAAGPQGD